MIVWSIYFQEYSLTQVELLYSAFYHCSIELNKALIYLISMSALIDFYFPNLKYSSQRVLVFAISVADIVKLADLREQYHWTTTNNVCFFDQILLICPEIKLFITQIDGTEGSSYIMVDGEYLGGIDGSSALWIYAPCPSYPTGRYSLIEGCL